MRFGVNILSRGPMASQDGCLTVSAAAERLGFDFVSVNDHVVVPADIASRYPYSEGGEWSAATVGECLEQLSIPTFAATSMTSSATCSAMRSGNARSSPRSLGASGARHCGGHVVDYASRA